MEVVQFKEDRVWENVLQALSGNGRLLQFQKLPRHELTAYLKAYGKNAAHDLRRVFSLVQGQQSDELNMLLKSADAGRIYCMLHNLVGCMKCWVESESNNTKLRRRWKVAHS